MAYADDVKERRAEKYSGKSKKLRSVDEFAIGDYSIDVGSKLNWIVGMTYAMQFEKDGQMNDCTYCAIETVESLGYYEQDFKKAKKGQRIYDLVVYDTIHVSGNLAAMYE